MRAFSTLFFCLVFLTTLAPPAQGALETSSSATENSCALLAKAKASGKKLTTTDLATNKTIDNPAFASQISACNKDAAMCGPTKKQLGSGAPPGLACMQQAGLVRKCFLVMTLLGQLACGETNELGEANHSGTERTTIMDTAPTPGGE